MYSQIQFHTIIKIIKHAQLTGHNAAIYSLAKGKEDGIFYSTGGDGWVVEWDIANPDLGRLIAKTQSKNYSLGFFPEQMLLAAGNMEGGLHWIDINGKNDLKNVAHHEQGIFSIISLDENHALTGGGMGRLTKWDLGKLTISETLHLTHTSIRSLSKKKNKILVGASDNHLYLLNEKLEITDTIEDAHDNSVFCTAFYPKEDIFVSGGRDAQLKHWKMDKSSIHQQNAHWYTINDIKIRPDGRIFATASRDKTIRIWDSKDFSLLKEINAARDGGHINSVNRLLWMSNDTLVSASDDRSMIIWKIETDL